MPVLSEKINVHPQSGLAQNPGSFLFHRVVDIANRTKYYPENESAEFCAAYYDPDTNKAIVANAGQQGARAYVVMINPNGHKALFLLNGNNEAAFGGGMDCDKNIGFQIYDLENITQYFPDINLQGWKPIQIVVVPSDAELKHEFSDPSIVGIYRGGTIFSNVPHFNNAQVQLASVDLGALSDNPAAITAIELNASDNERLPPQLAVAVNSDSPNTVLPHAICSETFSPDLDPRYYSTAAEEIFYLLNCHQLAQGISPAQINSGDNGFEIQFDHGWYGVFWDDANRKYDFTYSNTRGRPQFVNPNDLTLQSQIMTSLRDVLLRMIQQKDAARIAEIDQQIVDGSHHSARLLQTDVRQFEESRLRATAARDASRMPPAPRGNPAGPAVPAIPAPPAVPAALPIGGIAPPSAPPARIAAPPPAPGALGRTERSPHWRPLNSLETKDTVAKAIKKWRGLRAKNEFQRAFLTDLGYDRTTVEQRVKAGLTNRDLLAMRGTAHPGAGGPLPLPETRSGSVLGAGGAHIRDGGHAAPPGALGPRGDDLRPSSRMSLDGGSRARRLGFSLPSRLLLPVDIDRTYKPNCYDGLPSTLPQEFTTPNFFLQNGDRRNKYKILRDAFQGGNDNAKIDTSLNVIRNILVAASRDPSGQILTQKQILKAIDYAKKNGGLNSEIQARCGRVSDNSREAELLRVFSSRFQKMCEDCGIYSGREGADQGLRLLYIPERVMQEVYVNRTTELTAAQIDRAQNAINAQRDAVRGIISAIPLTHRATIRG